jgi:hypothetical protein
VNDILLAEDFGQEHLKGLVVVGHCSAWQLRV